MITINQTETYGTPTEQLKTIVETASHRGYRLLGAYKDPHDNYLWTVLCQLEDFEPGKITKHVTWIFNASGGGFGHGHYFHGAYDEAVVDFNERCAR